MYNIRRIYSRGEKPKLFGYPLLSAERGKVGLIFTCRKSGGSDEVAMNRVLKKSVVIICAVVLAAVCLCLCVACQDNTPSDSSVTVTLVNEGGRKQPRFRHAGRSAPRS